MKTTNLSFGILTALVVFCVSFSCKQKAIELDKPIKIENTLKSVSLWMDSIPVDPNTLLKSFERVNVAIDSIGYPDAGYKLWKVVSNDSLDFKIMVEGYWPDQKTYDIIHDHELYIKATKAEETITGGLKLTWYNRFNKIN